jgi:hypothetical protein
MDIFAQATNFTELAKAVGIIIAATAAAIIVFMKAWAAIKAVKDGTPLNSEIYKDCRDNISATYRILKEIKSFLEKEDPMADRPRVYTPKNMEESLKLIKEDLRISRERLERVEGMVDDIHGKSNVWDNNTGV